LAGLAHPPGHASDPVDIVTGHPAQLQDAAGISSLRDMKQKGTVAHQYLVMLWLAGVAVTVFLAGLGVFETTKTSKLADATSTKLAESNDLDPHRVAGSLLVLGTLLVLIAAGAARASRRQIGMSAVFFVLGVVQLILAGAGSDSGAFWGGLHVLNAFVLTGIAIGLVMEDRRFLAGASAAPASPG
jgi:Family of unknown function (DUF6220)